MQSKDHLSAADSVAPFGSSVGARPNPHLAWIVEWGAISLPLGNPSRVTCLSIHHDEHDAAIALHDCNTAGFNARMWPVSLQYHGEPALVPQLAERGSLRAAECADGCLVPPECPTGRCYVAAHIGDEQ